MIAPPSRNKAEKEKPRRGEIRQGFGVVINLEGNHMLNANAKLPEINLDASTPEELFSLPYATPLNLDVLQTINARSLSLLSLIQFSGGSGSFPSHKETMNALWLLEGQLTQLQQLLHSAEVPR